MVKIKCIECGAKVNKYGKRSLCKACARARRRARCREYDRTRRERKLLRRAIRACDTDIIVVPQSNNKVCIYARDDYMEMIS